jgi:ATP-dependent Clp protease ATP-binding subunit ClpX
MVEDTEKQYHCSFCSKERAEVERKIAGSNGVIICNECVDLCHRVIADERANGTNATA